MTNIAIPTAATLLFLRKKYLEIIWAYLFNLTMVPVANCDPDEGSRITTVYLPTASEWTYVWSPDNLYDHRPFVTVGSPMKIYRPSWSPKLPTPTVTDPRFEVPDIVGFP